MKKIIFGYSQTLGGKWNVILYLPNGNVIVMDTFDENDDAFNAALNYNKLVNEKKRKANKK